MFHSMFWCIMHCNVMLMMFPVTQIRIKRLSEFRGIVVNLFHGYKKIKITQRITTVCFTWKYIYYKTDNSGLQLNSNFSATSTLLTKTTWKTFYYSTQTFQPLKHLDNDNFTFLHFLWQKLEITTLTMTTWIFPLKQTIIWLTDSTWLFDQFFDNSYFDWPIRLNFLDRFLYLTIYSSQLFSCFSTFLHLAGKNTIWRDINLAGSGSCINGTRMH
jgi:hypothetical protein